MNEELIKSVLDQIVGNVSRKKNIYGAVFCVSTGNSHVDVVSAAGDIKEDSQYYIASINKFFVSAIILKLYTENKLDLNDNISKYLSSDLIQGLHTYKGQDYSGSITISHLMSLTSGLPGYLTDRQADGRIGMKELESGIDQAWPIDKVINEVKRMKAHFPPGEKGKAKYGDTNHQILGLVVEKVTGESINIALKNLFKELNMAEIMRNDSIPPPPAPDENTIRQYYEENLDQFTTPAKVHAFEIQLTDEIQAKKLQKSII